MSAWASLTAKTRVLPGRLGIDVPGQLFGDGAVEGNGYDLPVEVLDVEFDLVGRVGEIDLAGAGVENLDLLACS